MTRSPGYCGVVLAAGTPERLSSSLSPWPQGNSLGSTLLSTHIEVLNTVSELVVAVAGSNEPAITPTVYAHGGYLVSAIEGVGDFACLQIGVRDVLSRGRDTALVTPVDAPPISPATYRLMCEEYQRSPRDIWAVVLKRTESAVYPLLAGRELIEQILRAPADCTLQDILHANAVHVLATEICDNPGVSANSEPIATKP